jgi:hypothetical protein
MSTGGDEQTGGSTLPNDDPNACLVFVDGQWVSCPPPEQPEPEVPSQTLCPSCNQINPYVPPSGTRSNYYWDSKKIIEQATKPLNKGKNKK